MTSARSPHGQRFAARDVSGLGIGASGALADRSHDVTSNLSETELMDGYRAMRLTDRCEPCACGGTIESPSIPAAIAIAVDLHNHSTVHRQWRTWRESMAAGS